MSDTTGIDWTDSTWNIVTGCTRVSPACAHCYIERQTLMRIAHRRFELVDGASTTGVLLHPERLTKIPRGPKIFVCSMSDLFHDDVDFGFLVHAFQAMRSRPDRTFQLLTKRPDRMAQFLSLWRATHPAVEPNIWLGVSVENSRYAWRADVLREIPAAIHFISAEPLLGSLDGLHLDGIDWLITGGESGGRFARPTHPDWICGLRDACASAGVAFFFKQWGSWAPAERGVYPGDLFWSLDPDERYVSDADYVCASNESVASHLRYVGASPKAGGHLLDGVAWRQFPTTSKETVAA